MANKYLIKTWKESLITIYILSGKDCSTIYKNQSLRCYYSELTMQLAPLRFIAMCTVSMSFET